VIDGRELDETWLEVGHLVDQLIKENANAIWFIMSPLVVKGHPALRELQVMVRSNLSRATYPSLRGIATSQAGEILKRPLSSQECLGRL
jgi:hypothetical protein